MNLDKKYIFILTMLMSLQIFTSFPAEAQHPYPVTGQSVEMPLAEKTSQSLNKQVKSGFEAYDDAPLGDKTPLVLIHGIGGNQCRLFNWENFLSFVDKKPEFQSRYKIYLYHYDSSRSVPAISQNLQQTLNRFIGALGGRKIKILAYSEGGLLTRNALQDSYLDEHTEAVLTIATPFHGSPLANPEWLNQQAKTDSIFSLVRIGQKLAYKITGHLYPTFRQDFRWDNFDGALPVEQDIKYNGPLAKKVNYALARKKNFITYGSYFGLTVDPALVSRKLELKNNLPKEKKLFRNLFHKNFLFSIIRNNIGKMPIVAVKATEKVASGAVAISKAAASVVTADKKRDQKAVVVSSAHNMTITGITQSGLDTHPVLKSATDNESPQKAMMVHVQAETSRMAQTALLPNATVAAVTQNSDSVLLEPVSMMMFNDGISPISSTLWLGRYAKSIAGTSTAMAPDYQWGALKSLKGNHHARLFAGLDHRNWMDGTTRTGDANIQDLLNPEEPPRSVFEWIIHDLMG